MKRIKRPKDFWRGASDEEKYDYLVNSPFAPNEIKRFHKAEDVLLKDLIKGLSTESHQSDFAVVEEGCGPGRVIERIAYWCEIEGLPKPPKFIIGVDFEEKMLQNCISHLIGNGGKIRDWEFKSLAQKIAENKKISKKKANDIVRKRVILIEADATKPHLYFSSLIPIVIVAFGTFGNIEYREDFLSSMSEILSGNNGILFLSVFNRKKWEVGEKRYRELAERHFRQLRDTTYNPDRGEFTSLSGFLSRWFYAEEFKDILKPYFTLQTIKHIAEEVGIAATLRSRRSSPQLRKLLATFIKGKLTEKPGIYLRCPECGAILKNGILPLNNKTTLVCSRNPEHEYEVREDRGFLIPVLEV